MTLRVGTSVATVLTDDGVATATLELKDTPGATQVAASFGGDTIEQIASSSDSQTFTITKVDTSLELETPPGGVVPGGESEIFATLLDANEDPVPFRSIIFVIWDGEPDHVGLTKQVSTGADGRASLGSLPNLPGGPYDVAAYFSGAITLDPWTTPTGDQSTVQLVDPVYRPSSVAEGVLAVNPSVTGVEPGAVGRGAIQFPMTIVGAGFAPGSTVSVSGTGVTVSSVTYEDPSHLSVLVSVAANASLGRSQCDGDRAERGVGELHGVSQDQPAAARHRRGPERDGPGRGK